MFFIRDEFILNLLFFNVLFFNSLDGNSLSICFSLIKSISYVNDKLFWDLLNGYWYIFFMLSDVIDSGQIFHFLKK